MEENQVFGRAYSLKIGKPATSDSFFLQPIVARETPSATVGLSVTEMVNALSFPSPVKHDLVDREFIEITDLQITAFIPQDVSNSAGKDESVTIEVYNVSPESSRYIKQGSLVILDAGYEQDRVTVSKGLSSSLENSYINGRLYQGEVETVDVEPRGENTVTILRLREQVAFKRYAKISKSWFKGADGKLLTYKEILQDLLNEAKRAGINIGQVSIPSLKDEAGNTMPDSAPPTGLTVKGSLLDTINLVAKEAGYKSYLIQGSLYIHPYNAPSTFEAVQVSPSNVKGRITETSLSEPKKAKGNSTVSAIKLTTVLDPRISAEKILQVMEGPFTGFYNIISVEHVLDYEGEAWDTLIEAEVIK